MSKQRCRFTLGIYFLVTFAAISPGGLQAKRKIQEQPQVPTQALNAQGAPLFKVDPFWPKPLPNR